MEEIPIPGWGIDRRVEDRPGHPLEQRHTVGHDTIEGQAPYSDTVPLRGLSGVIRRRAYRHPDWRPRRWMLLMLADRVDVFESRLTMRTLLFGGGLVAALLLRRLRR